jgi:hypothetical protein
MAYIGHILEYRTKKIEWIDRGKRWAHGRTRICKIFFLLQRFRQRALCRVILWKILFSVITAIGQKALGRSSIWKILFSVLTQNWTKFICIF